MEDYTIGETIGKGAFGTVYLGTQRSSGKPVVIKEILKSNLTSPGKIKRAQRDARIPQFLGCQHKNIICVLAAVEDERAVYIISEYVAGATTLNKYEADLSTKEGQFEVLDIFQQLADGLAYMHSKGVAHGDIKVANILIKGTIPFYIDFDLACTFRESILPRFRCGKGTYGTPNYMAPEVILGTERDQSLADIYALGIVFFIVIQGKAPFQRKNANQTYQAILHDPVPEFSSGIPALDQLILKMLNKSPDRPSAIGVRDSLNEMIRLI